MPSLPYILACVLLFLAYLQQCHLLFVRRDALIAGSQFPRAPHLWYKAGHGEFRLLRVWIAGYWIAVWLCLDLPLSNLIALFVPLTTGVAIALRYLRFNSFRSWLTEACWLEGQSPSKTARRSRRRRGRARRTRR
jgi:hypothetical protein